MPGITFVLPTRNRPDELAKTLDFLGNYPIDRLGNTPPEIIVVDNASDPPARHAEPAHPANNARVEIIRLEANLGTAARNIAAKRAANPWVVMLDDDSAPVRGDLGAVLGATPASIAALGGEIFLPDGRREAGGLPEVIVGCGCAVRREAFLAVGGYDADFGYYAEEYDLCAKLIRDGHSIAHTRAVAFSHRKVQTGRDFAMILARLVRNNLWVIARYAPPAHREAAIHATLDRYMRIAEKESVIAAYSAARDEALATIDAQRRTPLGDAAWSRFTGEAAVRTGVIPDLHREQIDRVRIVEPGKGEDTIRDALNASGIDIDPRAQHAVIGTLSPGPMLDAKQRTPDARTPWELSQHAPAPHHAPE